MARLQMLFSRYRMLIVVVAYGLLASLTLWNLLLHLNTAVPGGKDSDYYQFLWGYWWMGQALGQGQSPLWTDYVLYPHVSNLSVHTLAPIWYPVYALVAPLTSGPGAGNVMILLGYVFTGAAMYAWLRRQLPTGWTAEFLAFLGGLAFAFSPYMMSRAAFSHLNLTPLWWFPVILLVWDEIVFPQSWPRWLSAIVLGLALWGGCGCRICNMASGCRLPLWVMSCGHCGPTAGKGAGCG
ncbi:MAG TPA: hypothetical protein VHO69_00750 [Phototrophicaceae bacterium]|nr:hypothetical protein [Phototrophicaceae bacterium]